MKSFESQLYERCRQVHERSHHPQMRHLVVSLILLAMLLFGNLDIPDLFEAFYRVVVVLFVIAVATLF